MHWISYKQLQSLGRRANRGRVRRLTYDDYKRLQLYELQSLGRANRGRVRLDGERRPGDDGGAVAWVKAAFGDLRLNNRAALADCLRQISDAARTSHPA